MEELIAMRVSDIHLKYEDDFWDRCFADGRPFEESLVKESSSAQAAIRKRPLTFPSCPLATSGNRSVAAS